MSLTLHGLQLAVRESVVCVFAYIDNVVWAIRPHLSRSAAEWAADVHDAWQRTCAHYGARLKPEASTSGRTVDWLGVVLTAGARTATFRSSFVDKASALLAWTAKEAGPVRAWWRAAAVALHILWVRRRPLGLVVDLMRWLSRTAAAVSAGELDWTSSRTPWVGALHGLIEQLRAVSDPWSILAVPGTCLAVGVSDAAGGIGGFRAYIYRVGDEVYVGRQGRTQDPNVAIEEYLAMWIPLMQLARRVGPGGIIYWSSDNTDALGWCRRSWSPAWCLNACIVDLHEALCLAQRTVRLRWIPSAENHADWLTRCMECRSARSHTCLDRCQSMLRARCQCTEICEHVVADAKTWARTVGLIGV